MKFKRLAALSLSGIMALGLMTGCGGGNAPSSAGTSSAQQSQADTQKESSQPEESKAASGEKEKIIVSTWTDSMEEFREMKEKFESLHSDIEVELLEFPSAEYKDKLVTTLAGGADLDVITHKNNAEYADIASKNQLLELGDLVKRDNVDIAPYGPLFEGLQIDGKTYGLPYEKTAWVLYYNKDLFDAAGVPYPSDDMTWDEFRELAKKMTSGEGTERIAGAYLHTWPQTWYGMALQKGCSIIDQDLSEFEKALQFRLDLEADGSIMTYTDAKATNAHYKTEFANGRTAMNVMGDFHAAQLRDLEASGDVTFDWDIAAMPHPEGVEPNTTWGTAMPISVNAGSKHQEAAWEFVKFVSGIEGAKISASRGNLAAYSCEEVEALYKGDGTRRPLNVGILSSARVYMENPSVIGAGTIKDEIYGRESELSFNGERSAADTFKVIKEKVQAELNK